MPTIINITGQDLVYKPGLIGAGTLPFTIHRSPAPVAVPFRSAPDIFTECGHPIPVVNISKSECYGGIILPPRRYDTVYVVTGGIAALRPDREDLYVPSDWECSSTGIVCRGLGKIIP